MSGGNGNNEWSEIFASFHARHQDPQGTKLPFTVIFNTAIAFLMANCEVPLEWRFLDLRLFGLLESPGPSGLSGTGVR